MNSMMQFPFELPDYRAIIFITLLLKPSFFATADDELLFTGQARRLVPNPNLVANHNISFAEDDSGLYNAAFHTSSPNHLQSICRCCQNGRVDLIQQ